MRIGNGAKIKLDFTNDLYDHMIEEIKEYTRIMDDPDTSKVTERLLTSIERYARLGTEDDGTEYAIIQLFPSDASELISILAMVASTTVDVPDSHYERLRAQRAEKININNRTGGEGLGSKNAKNNRADAGDTEVFV